MYEYMIGSEKWGPIQAAYETAVRDMSAKDPELVAEMAGVRYSQAERAFFMESLGQELAVRLPECYVVFAETGRPPVWQWRGLALHYLLQADGAALSGKLSHYREMSTVGGFVSPFFNDSMRRLTQNICIKPVNEIRGICEALGASIQSGNADVCAVFPLFPRFPVTLQLWLTDDEMEGSANMLFDARCDHYLPAADIVDIATVMIVDFMLSQAMISEENAD